MHKRILSFFLVFTLLLSVIPLATFADEHQHTFGDNKRGLDMGSLPDEYSCPATFYETPCESLCGYSKYEWTFAGASDSFVDVSGLNALQVYSRWRKWFEKAYGASANLEKMDTTNAGANIPAAGGRNPKGYGSEGKANVNASGVEILWAEPFGLNCINNDGFTKNAPATVVTGKSPSGPSYPSSGRAHPLYYFEAPVTGLYYIGKSGSPYDLGTISFFYRNNWAITYLDYDFTEPYKYSISLTKGETCYLTMWINVNGSGEGLAFRSSLNNCPISIEPLGDSSITTTNNITINNNTWKGNIYTDNSTHLTYIYPEYTTVNEKNETVTNISTNPIIYNSETYQYYTYDQTTNNYYYITYPNQPTPPPTATPSPTPSPSPIPSGPSVKPGVTHNYIIPQMSSNSYTDKFGTWIASGSTKFSDQYDFYKAFDLSTSTAWCMGSGSGGSGGRELPCYVEITIPNPESYYIDGYAVRGHKSSEWPSAWKLQASNDGMNYVDLDVADNQNLSDFTEHSYDLSLHKAYKYYRLYVTAYTTSYMGVGLFNLYGYSASDIVVPTPTPAPTPGGGSGGGGGSGSGGDSGSSGSSWWDKLLSKIGDAIIDGLLGAISAVLKLIFKLFSTILGWIIWAVSRVFDLLPFLPPGLGGLLVGGVVVCFVIGIIKFIRG